MSLTVRRVHALLEAQGEDPETAIYVGDMGPAPAPAGVFSFAEFLGEAPSRQSNALGVCINPSRENLPTLAHLRDVQCSRVIVIQTDGRLSKSELLALGFQRIVEEGDCAVYLHSAELTDRPREWNNSEHWAHPENFDKSL